MTYVAAKISSPKGHFLTLEPQVSRCADKKEEGERWRGIEVDEAPKTETGKLQRVWGKKFCDRSKTKKKAAGVKKKEKKQQLLAQDMRVLTV